MLLNEEYSITNYVILVNLLVFLLTSRVLTIENSNPSISSNEYR